MREFRCSKCGYRWVSRSEKPRCSKCHSRKVYADSISFNQPEPTGGATLTGFHSWLDKRGVMGFRSSPELVGLYKQYLDASGFRRAVSHFG